MVDRAVEKSREAADAQQEWKLAKTDEASMAVGDVLHALASCETLYDVVAGGTRSTITPSYSWASDSKQVAAMLDTYVEGLADCLADDYRNVDTRADRESNYEAVMVFLTGSCDADEFANHRRKREIAMAINRHLSGRKEAVKPFGKYVGHAAETAWGRSSESKPEPASEPEPEVGVKNAVKYRYAVEDIVLDPLAAAVPVTAVTSKKWAALTPALGKLSRLPIPSSSSNRHPRRRGGPLHDPSLCGPHQEVAPVPQSEEFTMWKKALP
jgi:hypothetical protein